MRSRLLATMATVAVVATLLYGAAACDGGDDPADTGLDGTALERATAILGSAPTGVAKDIVECGHMIVANDRAYPPQSSLDETSGELVGFDVDVAKAVGEILGLEVRFVNPDWETIPAGLNSGRIDVSIGSMSITPEKDKSVDFTAPYYFATAQAFVKEGGPQITSVADLDGTSVGVGVATTYYDFLKQESKAVIKTYATDTDAFPDLRSGKLDFVVTAGPTGQQAILAGEPFAFSGGPLYYEDLAFAVAEGEVDWLKLLDHAIATMRENGTLTDLSKEWYQGLDLTVES
jgi:polar amino acid transport system substrate-binding protein